jgi:hypothetical protein
MLLCKIQWNPLDVINFVHLALLLCLSQPTEVNLVIIISYLLAWPKMITLAGAF